MPRITSALQRQLTVTAPDQEKRTVVDRTTFDIGAGFNNVVEQILEQSDGKILVGGAFTELDGNTRNRLVRLNTDGTEDTDFSTNLGTGFSSRVDAITQQSDGKILVGGVFTSFNGTTRNRLVRLNADGTEDTAFYFTLGTAFNGTVYAVALQSDGKILVGGNFTSFFGNTRNRLIRFNTDGTTDTTFRINIGTGFDNTVDAIAVQSDGKILVGGDFTSFNGNTRNRLVRLNTDGTEDTAFYTNLGTGFDGNDVDVIAEQPDGKILVGGDFLVLNGVSRLRLVRLNTDGTEDTDFYTNLGTSFGPINDIAVQPDGKIVVGGSFSTFNGNTRYDLVRLNADGTEDTAFYTNLGTAFSTAFDDVNSVNLQSDGKILVGGEFTTFNGKTRRRLVALNLQGTELPLSLPAVSYTLTVGAEVTEGQPLQLTVDTANVRDGSQLQWRILDRPEEFVAGAGTTSVSSDQAEVIVFPLDDGIFEPQRETFRVRLSKPLGTEVAVTSDIEILDNSLFIFQETATPPSQFRLEAGNRIVLTDSYIIAGPQRDFFGTSETIVVWNRQTLDITQTITNPNPLKHNDYEISPDYFGNSFDANDQYLVIGSPRDGLSGDLNGSGLAYVYEINNGQWELTQTLQNPNNIGTTAGDLFGYEVSLEGSVALISASREDDSTNTDEGKVYVYDLDSASPDPMVVLDNTNGTSEDRFGERIAQSLSYAAISSLRADRSKGGSEDTAFYTNLGTGFNSIVAAIALQSDGKILVGGFFGTFNGNARNRLVRFNTDGTEDTVFYTNLGTGFGSTIGTVALQSDGKILVGGIFPSLNGNTRNRLVRLNSNGTEDTAFYTNLGSGFDNTVDAIALQSDGKILVGGEFTQLNGNTRNRLVRLNADGTEDTVFYTNLGTGFGNYVSTVILQSDGKILVGGNFLTLNGTTRNRLVRLNSDGTVDTVFYTNLGTGFNVTIYTIALQSDGKILVGGGFTTFNGNTRNRLVRLNADGTEDTAFYSNLGTGFGSTVIDIVVQPDGKILVGGSFTTFDDTTRNRLVRLNSDGTVDTDFYLNFGTGFNSTVYAIALQSDGKILVGGFFSTFNSNSRSYLVRLESDDDVFADSGKVDIYDRSDWSLITTLINPEPLIDGAVVTNDQFGYSIDITDNYTVVATNYEITGSNVPKIYVYRNTDWRQIYTVSLDGVRNQFRVKLQGDYLFVVAVNRTSPLSTRILIFDLKRANLYAEISQPPGIEFQLIQEITVKDDLVAIGDPGYDDSTVNTNTGQVYLFRSQENINSYTGSIFGMFDGAFRNGIVFAVSLQSDNKILVGGSFTDFNKNSRARLVRLNDDGADDTAFYANLGTSFDNTVDAITLQSDGKILVGGRFTGFNGNARNRLVRLNSDGTEDTAFYGNLGTGFSFNISAIAVQPDGKILVGGGFTTFNGNTRNYLVRLNADGTEDTAFYTNLGTGFGSSGVGLITLQSDGKILAGGNYTTFNGVTRRRLMRLNTDGTEDTVFYTNLGTGFDNAIETVALQSDGKILVGGTFTTLNGNTRSRLVRLNTDGTEDTAFYSNLGGGFGSTVIDIVVQPDGKILVGGTFSIFNGTFRNYLVRLNADGTEDTAFYANLGTGFGSTVRAIALQSDGKILVGGDFTTLNGNPPPRMVELNEDGTSNTITSTTTLTTAAIPDYAPINIFAPALFGSSQAVVGQVVRTTLGTWVGTQPLTYSQQWQRGTVDIVGATSTSYTVTTADIGSTLRCEITVTNSQGSTTAVSNSSATVPPTYSISAAANNVDEGSALSFTVVTQGVSNGTTLYWTVTNSSDFSTSSGSFVINSNTGSFSVTPTADFSLDEGSETFQLEIRTGSISGDIVATSDPITINDTSVGSSPVNTAAPTISGTVAVGSTLSCSTGSWTGQPTPTFTYQWQNNSADIVGATSSSYTLTSDDYQDLIRCQVTATNASGTATANSAATAGVAAQLPSNTSSPSISGDAVAYQTLTVSEGTWVGFPEPTFSYQWLRNGSNISGATSSTYTLTTDDTGSTLLDRYTISCRVTATNVAGSGSATSSSTSTVMPFLGQQVAGGHFVGLISQLGNGSPSHYLIAAYKSDEQNLEMRTFYGGETYTGPSDVDGALNTQYFFELHVPGENREYPAAVYATNYSSGGYTDWYIPAKSELEIAYYNLKPNSGSNNTNTGANIYAVPPRYSNYTTTVPGRTSNTDFREGGAFAFSTFSYWTSTSNSGTTGITAIRFLDGQTTVADGIGSNVVRPFRRVAI